MRELFLIFVSLTLVCFRSIAQDDLFVRFDAPAREWEGTLPLGNGRLGMMPDGGVRSETVILNDITMWSGSRENTANPDALRYLPDIRKALLRGDNLKAQELMYQYFRCGGQGSAFGAGKDAPYGCFQMLGVLSLTYKLPQGDSIGYGRRLHLPTGVAQTSFDIKGTSYKREYFVSYDRDVMVIRLTADRARALSLKATLSRPERATVSAQEPSLVMKGQLNDGKGGVDGVRFVTKMKAFPRGGDMQVTADHIEIKDADEVLLLLSSATDMMEDRYEEVVDSLLSAAASSDFDTLRKGHEVAFRRKFDRLSIDLGKQDNDRTTEQRLYGFAEDEDPAFAALYLQYARYLMISGTREGSLPLNLQGLWANSLQTPWNGDYHLNINVQMNYWPVEVCNLSELHLPLIEYTKSLAASGQKTAQDFYGTKGWVAHVISNPWLFAAPGEHASWGATNTGGAWLCAHLWEHYLFSQDTIYLRDVYPVIRGAAEFFLDNLIPEPKHGWLVTAPSSSPENSFLFPDSDKPVYVCLGPTMDMQIVRELLDNLISAATLIGLTNDVVVEKAKEVIPHLAPMQISSHGYLQEWVEDYVEVEPQHRHVSHLYGLYPAHSISPATTPDLADAARLTLERRGDGGTGWSRAWKVCFRARLYDGERAFRLLKSLLSPALSPDRRSKVSAGTYPNLFCAHPPFQIDGNLGGAAGIAEMLVQSHEGFIHLLPAIPDRWAKSGRVGGFRVRPGATIDFAWCEGKVTEIGLTVDKDGIFRLKLPGSSEMITVQADAGEVIRLSF